jgi:predicted oxidoreductase
MQTMNRESITTAMILGVLVGLVDAAVVAITGTGVAGLYAFGLVGGLAVVVFMGWSDVRARFSGRRSSRTAPSRSPGRAEHRRRPARSS